MYGKYQASFTRPINLPVIYVNDLPEKALRHIICMLHCSLLKMWYQNLAKP